MKKSISIITILFFITNILIAQNDSAMVAVTGQNPLPDGLSLEFRNDTLFVSCSADQLPTHLVVAAADKANLYKRILNDATDDLMEDHPADDIYKSVWTSARVNPYSLPVDSIRDSVKIDCRGWQQPIKGNVTSKFGPRKYRYHFGTDLRLQIGDTIRCSWDGQVRIVKYDRTGYGNYVVVRHDNGFETVYAHMARVFVEENERIFAGEVIGLGGNTGRSTGPHLHYEVRYLGNAINPEHLFDFKDGTLRDTTYLITKRNTFYYQQQLKEMQAAKYYVVRSGDNLSVIARRYGTTVNAICKLNNIRPDSVIRIGQRLRVR